MANNYGAHLATCNLCHHAMLLHSGPKLLVDGTDDQGCGGRLVTCDAQHKDHVQLVAILHQVGPDLVLLHRKQLHGQHIRVQERLLQAAITAVQTRSETCVKL